jgi:hypothetical protein
MFLLLRKGQFGEKLEKEVAISYHPISFHQNFRPDITKRGTFTTKAKQVVIQTI